MVPIVFNAIWYHDTPVLARLASLSCNTVSLDELCRQAKVIHTQSFTRSPRSRVLLAARKRHGKCAKGRGFRLADKTALVTSNVWKILPACYIVTSLYAKRG